MTPTSARTELARTPGCPAAPRSPRLWPPCATGSPVRWSIRRSPRANSCPRGDRTRRHRPNCARFLAQVPVFESDVGVPARRVVDVGRERRRVPRRCTPFPPSTPTPGHHVSARLEVVLRTVLPAGTGTASYPERCRAWKSRRAPSCPPKFTSATSMRGLLSASDTATRDCLFSTSPSRMA